MIPFNVHLIGCTSITGLTRSDSFQCLGPCFQFGSDIGHSRCGIRPSAYPSQLLVLMGAVALFLFEIRPTPESPAVPSPVAGCSLTPAVPSPAAGCTPSSDFA